MLSSVENEKKFYNLEACIIACANFCIFIGILFCFCCRLLTLYFFKINCKKIVRNTISVSKVLDSDQGRSVRKLIVKVINR